MAEASGEDSGSISFKAGADLCSKVIAQCLIERHFRLRPFAGKLAACANDLI